MLKALEKTFTVAMLFYTTGAALPFVTARLNGYSGLGASRIELLLQTVAYAAAFCFFAIRWRDIVQGALHAKWIMPLLALAVASTAWSQNPSLTLRRSIVLLATTAFGVYFAARFDLSEQLQLLAAAFALVICASFLFAIFAPQYGIDHTLHYGDWQGAFYQKNMLARAMVLATLVFFFGRFSLGWPLRWLGIAGSLSLLFLSHSVTGMIVFAVIVLALPAHKLFRTRYSFAIPIFLFLAMALSVAIAFVYDKLPTLLDLLHRDAGLTGRFELWDAVLLAISRRPWLGYGFNGFWQGMTGESANVLLTVKWSPGYAHNGFLDLVLDLGLLGLVLFVGGYLVLWWQAVSLASKRSGPAVIWPLAYLAFVLFYNLTEGPAVSQNNISWVLYVATAVSLGLYLPAKQANARPALVEAGAAA